MISVLDSISKKDETSENEVLIQVERVESQKSTVHGMFQAEKPGEYVLYWDNSYSWSRSKELKYVVRCHDEDGKVIYESRKLKKEKKDEKKEPKKEDQK